MNEVFDAAWEALEEGEPERCLQLLESTDGTRPQRYLLACQAYLELGELGLATKALQEADSRGIAAQDPERLWALAELQLFSWQIDQARASLESISERDPSAAVLSRLALCAELDGDFAAADQLQARAHAIDPDIAPRPQRLSPAAFDRVVEKALQELRPEHRAALGNVPIVVEPMPTRALVPAGDEASVPPELLGLFVGSSLAEDAQDPGGNLPPSIHLFQRNLERFARDEEELIEEIRITLFHEIGHRLGFDEEGVDELGLG